MHKSFLILLIITVIGLPSLSFGQEVTFTQEDRERLIRIETKIEEGYKAINTKFDKLDGQLYDNELKSLDCLHEDMRELKTIMLWGFILVFMEIVISIIIVLWHRRAMISFINEMK